MKILDRSFKCFLVLPVLLITAACAPGDEPPAEPVAEMGTLVSAEWLMEHIDDPDLVVLDATVLVEADAYGNFRSLDASDAYASGHIPTAGFANLKKDLRDTQSPLEFGLPSPDEFAAAMSALGVGDDTRVVLYDNMRSIWAARVWWMLRWIGFDRAAILDGGLSAWTAAGGALSAEPADEPARELSVNLRPEVMAYEEEVRASLGDDSVQIVDALSEAHYRGEMSMYDQPGHIPGAVNLPTSSIFDETGRFRSNDELAALLDADPDARTITYCGGGIAAAADAFALTRAGYTNIAIYAASLEEWSADPDNPMDVVLEFDEED